MSQQDQQHEQHTVDAVADQIGEEPKRLRKRFDATRLLSRMQEGVIVDLRMSRPRFYASVHAKRKDSMRAGIVPLGLVNSSAAQQVLQEYFTFGRYSLLPKDEQDKLATAEHNARACLERHAFKTHWGAFVPTTNYKKWKEENEKYKQEFWDARDEMLARYDEICENVIAAYRPLAEDAWKQALFGTTVVQAEAFSHTLVDQLRDRLVTEEGKAAYIEMYLARIREAIPGRQEIADAFQYEEELGVIPLPSQLSQDVGEANKMVRDRMVRDAEIRAELERIEAQRRADLSAIETKRQAEEQAIWDQQQAEQEQQAQQREYERERLLTEQRRLRQQTEMEQDLLTKARRQKEQLIDEFFTGVIGQVNEIIREVCDNALTSIDEHGGRLRGPVSTRLKTLVDEMERLNFIDDEQVTRQIVRLRLALPTDGEKEAARNGTAPIDTTRLRQVVQELSQEANETLLELGLSPRERTRRQAGITAPDENLLHLDQPRAHRKVQEDQGAVLENQEPIPITKRRSRKKV
jgi:hypothetical protein